MNPWLLAASVLMFALVPLGIVTFRGDPMDRLVGLETAGALVTMILMLLSLGFQRLPMMDIALASALLAFGSGLVFARFLERWL